MVMIFKYKNFKYKKFKCLLFEFTYVWVLVSCGKLELSQERDLRTLIQAGRRPVFVSSNSGDSLALNGILGVDPNVHSVTFDKETHAATKITFVNPSRSTDYFSINQISAGAAEAVSRLSDFMQVKFGELKLLDENAVRVIDERNAVVTFERVIDRQMLVYSFLDVHFFSKDGKAWFIREIQNNTFSGRSLKDRNWSLKSFALNAEFEGFNLKVSGYEFFPVVKVNGDIELHETELFHLNNGVHEYYVRRSLVTGELVEAFSPVKYNTTTLTAPALPRSYRDSPELMPIPDVELKIKDKTSRSNLIGEIVDSEISSGNIRLYSGRVDLLKNAKTVSFHANIANGQVELKDSLNRKAINAFIATHRINQFTRRHIRESQTAYLTKRLSVSIDVPGSCNAFYTRSTINLFKEGGNCANIALVNDVIYHEWGHGLDDHTGRKVGIQDDAFSEAIGDILSSYMTGSSNLGTGFFTDKVEGIRQLENNKRFPQDLQREPHADGLIVGGAFWDLRRLLIDRYGNIKGSYLAESYFFKHLLVTDSYRESYEAVLRLDDDDGNSATPSPNHCLITEAFAKHGLAETKPGCADTFEVENVIDIGIKVTKSDANGASVLIGTDKLMIVWVCPGAKDLCLKGQAGAIVAQAMGKTSGKRVIYSAEGLPRLSNEGFITVILKGQDGAVVGTRTFRTMQR